MKKLIKVILPVLIGFSAAAQDRSHQYTNLLNGVLINSAEAGRQNGILANFDARTMLGGMDGSPRVANFTLSGSMGKDAGLGLKVVTDASGVFQTNNFEGIYSKQIQLSQKSLLRFGLNLGMVQTNLRQELLNDNVNQADPMLTDKNLGKMRFSSGFGLAYRFNERLEASLSFPTLVTGDEKINGFFVGSASYKFISGASKQFSVKPTLNFYNFQHSDKMLDIYANCQWKEMLGLSAGYRSNGSLLIGTSFDFKVFGIRYMYYHHLSALENLAPAQNEVSVILQFGEPKRRYVEPKAATMPADPFTVELDKINKRLNGLIQVEKTNPGLVDVPAELKKIDVELNSLLKNQKVEDPQQLRLIKDIQDTMDVLISKYSK